IFTSRSRSFFQNRSESGAGVFRIDINPSAENCLVTDVSPRKIKTPLNGEMSFVFNLLGNDFAEDQLLGEVFGPDDDAVLAGRPAGAKRKQKPQQNTKLQSSVRPLRIVNTSQRGLNRFSSQPKLISANKAMAAAGIAPARIT
ncbi:MAG: hypothetical protein QOD84_2390, partial [Acidobacteriaceae bacterium]